MLSTDERSHSKGATGLRVLFCLARCNGDSSGKRAGVDQKFIQQVIGRRGKAWCGPWWIRPCATPVTQFQFSSSKTSMAITDSCRTISTWRIFRRANTRSDAGRDDFFDAKGADAVVVSGKTADVALSMIPGATVSGRVLNPAGRPMPNATVTAYQLVVSKWPSRSPPRRSGDHRRPRRLSDILAPSRRILHRRNRRVRHCRHARTSNVVTLSRVDQIVRTYYPAAVAPTLRRQRN